MDVISNNIYGQSFNLVTKCDQRALVSTIMASSCHSSLEASFSTFLNTKFNKWFKWFNPNKSVSSTPAIERERLLRVLAGLIEERTHSKENESDRKDLISILSAARDPKTGDKLTEVEVRDEARSMLALGWSPSF